MADLAFIVTILVFFALCTAFIRGLDRIVRSHGRGGVEARGAGAVSWDNIIGLVLAVLLAGYLVVALLFPEKF